MNSALRVAILGPSVRAEAVDTALARPYTRR
jgi:hypothetical protein